MGKLFKLVERIQEGDINALDQVVRQFEPKVNSLLTQTKWQNREDLKQELFLAIVLKSKNYNLNEVPSFDEFQKSL